MYIAQWIARQTNHSRRSAVELVKANRVKLNQQVATVTQTVHDGDVVTIDGTEVATTASTYIALNKPRGYVCSRKAQDERPTIYELLPDNLQHLTYVGRLDADSSGLLLMSNDGDWIQELTHPKHEIKRVYHVELDSPLSEAKHKKLSDGVILTDGLSQLSLTGKGNTWRIELFEGRNRQIRRSFEAIGHKVRKLHRTQHGPFALGNLPIGQYREITSVDKM